MCFATSSSHSSSCIVPAFSPSLPLALTASSSTTASTSRAVSPALRRRPFAVAAALRAPPCRVRISHSSSSHPPSQSSTTTTTSSASASSSTSALSSLGLPAAAAAALAAQVRALDARIGYLGPVSRHKVVTAVELAEKHARNPQQMAANAAVAAIVADLKMDCETVCAALLRHVQISKPDVEIELETCVGTDVLRVLKIYLGIQERIELAQDELFNETSYANLRELVLVGAQNEHRAISLKLASAVVDTRALDVVADEHRRKLLAKRALYLYAPLANQLGIWFIQSELEMLAFMNLQWERYVETKRVVGERMRACQGSLDDAKKLLERLLNTTPSVKARVRSARVMGRVKGIYSVYRKMERSGKNVAEIYDLLALRVIIQPKRTDDQSELDACYAVAAAIQEHYETMETRAKDYLATPKPNGYRSLHLTVHAPAKQQAAATHPIEIQIRTEKMHHVAEFGAAAHWIYKEREEDTSSPSANNNNTSATAHDEESNGHGGGSAKQAAVVARVAVRDPSCIQRKFGYARPRVSVPVDLTAPVSSRTGATVTLAPRGVRPRPLLTRLGGDELLDAKRRGYVASLAAAIRASRVIVSSCGQLYQLTLGSTLYDFMSCLGVASLGAIAMVNGNVAPLSQRLEMNDIVCFISSVGEL